MTGDDIAAINTRLDRLEAGQGRMETRMTALETARAEDMAAVPGIVERIIEKMMPPLVRDAVREVIREQRLVADAQRFREFVSLGRKVGMAVLTAAAVTMALAILNGWLPR